MPKTAVLASGWRAGRDSRLEVVEEPPASSLSHDTCGTRRIPRLVCVRRSRIQLVAVLAGGHTRAGVRRSPLDGAGISHQEVAGGGSGLPSRYRLDAMASLDATGLGWSRLLLLHAVAETGVL